MTNWRAVEYIPLLQGADDGAIAYLPERRDEDVFKVCIRDRGTAVHTLVVLLRVYLHAEENQPIVAQSCGNPNNGKHDACSCQLPTVEHLFYACSNAESEIA
jgi:hypothetical protein